MFFIHQAPAPRTQQASILGLDKLAAQKNAEKQAALEAAGLGGGRGKGSRGALSFVDLDTAAAPAAEEEEKDAGGGSGGGGGITGAAADAASGDAAAAARQKESRCVRTCVLSAFAFVFALFSVVGWAGGPSLLRHGTAQREREKTDDF